MSDTLIASFMGDEPVLIEDDAPKNVAILQHFEIEEATEAQAKKMHREVLAQIGNVFATLRRIHASKAFRKLGYTNFPDYLKSLRGQSEAFQIDRDKFYRLLRHDDVCDRLLTDGVNSYLVGNLKEAHTDILHAELPETLWQEAIDRLIENKAAHKPIGKAAEFDHMFKFTAEMVKDACARVNQRIASELPSDPFNDSPRQLEPKPAVFDATDDGRIVVDTALVVDAPEWVRTPSPVAPNIAPNLRELAPIPQKPPAPVMPKSDLSRSSEPEEICLAFMGVEPHEMDDDVLWVSGTDGPNVYTIPVRKSALMGKV